MFVTIAVVMCRLVVAAPTLAPDRDCTAEEVKVVEVVTDSDRDDKVDFFACQLGQAPIADWKRHHPIYFKDAWRIGRIMCVPGHYEPPGKA